MNYRHAFHAGNFADLVKHAALLELLRQLASEGPLVVIDTHAGRGLYDLAGVEAQRSGEAAAGVGQLLRAGSAPAPLLVLKDKVQALNAKGGRRYPGSPWLIAESLRPGDSYLACELRPEEHAALAQAMRGRPKVRTLCADGYEVAVKECPAQGRALVLIDPPFEKADDYRRCVEVMAQIGRRNPDAVVMVWLPLKDLETFDGFLRDAEDACCARLLVGETRMRPLTDPMKMNGCALVLLRGPDAMLEPLNDVCAWVAQTLGDGGRGQAWASS